MTEEDVKARFIIPFLTSLGFAPDELSFEQSFTVRFGKNVARVDTGEQIREGHPRLDILVKRNNQNFFIVEVKTDNQELTEGDRDQAVSYARLLDDMAPIAVVTNGKEFKLYKVGNKAEIEKDKERILNYHVDGDLEKLYNEALENFIGYSKENVRTFCRAQIEERMNTLMGSHEVPDRKFIPALFVASKELRKTVDGFLQSGKTAFAVVGESGKGKTCALCGLALELVEQCPTLFYRARELSDDLAKTMSDDFNWQFSARLDEVSLLKRLSQLFKGERIIVLIDGLDEWNLANREEVLGNFARHVRSLRIRLIVSCKATQWGGFLARDGTPTAFSLELFQKDGRSPAHLLKPFDDEEFYDLIRRYREFYGFEGGFQKQVLEECRNDPFLLRIFFELSQKKQLSYLTFSIREFYDMYYQAVTQKIPGEDQEKAGATMREVARVLFERNVDGISMGMVRKELGLTVNESLAPALFDCSILEKSGEGVSPQIRFYFEKLRDYLIAFHVKNWDSITLDEFRAEMKTARFRGVFLDAIQFFYPFASIEKQQVLDEPLRTNAERYLDSYVNTLNTHFSNLRRRFLPYTEGDIGFVASLHLDRVTPALGAHGFRPIKDESERIRFVPVSGSIFQDVDISEIYFLGAKRLQYRSSSKGFVNLDLKKEVLEGEIFEQVIDIVKNRYLDERNNYYLSLEKVLEFIVDKRYAKQEFSKRLPIAVESIEYELRYRRAFRIVQDALQDEIVKKGLAKETRSGCVVSYSFSFTKEDREYIAQRARSMAKGQRELESRKRYLDLDQLEAYIGEAISGLKARDSQITETVLPDQDGWRREFGYYEPETLSLAVLRLYTLFLQEYKTLVEVNFPTLKNHFELYSQMPVHYFLSVEPGEHCPRITLLRCKNMHSNTNEVTLCEKGELIDYTLETFTHAGNVHNVLGWQGLLACFMISHSSALRTLVYEQVQGELSRALQFLN